MADFFSTLLGISIQAVSIIITFYAAYHVYLRQQRDRHRENIVKDLQSLNKLVTKWSFLEEYTPEWSSPTSKYFQILEKEQWKKSVVDESLKGLLANVNKLFIETQKKEMEIKRTSSGRIVAAPLYLQVKSALNDLVLAIYREFPQPPGDYKISEHGEIPYDIKSLIRHDFPNNKEDILRWIDRFSLFFDGIIQVYYRIKPVLSTLRKINEESAEQTTKWIEEIREKGESLWAIDGLKESTKISIAEINYYEQVFGFLSDMKSESDKIKDEIGTYDNYFYKGKWKTVVSFCVMAITGLVIPFVALFSNLYLFPLETVEIITAFGFGLSTLTAIYLMYRDISKF
jgi:hypothetical protein